MSRITNGLFFAAMILLTATTQGQTNDLFPPIDTNRDKTMSRLQGPGSVGYPFMPLIDDVINRAIFIASDSGPAVQLCQLNAPLPPVATKRDGCGEAQCAATECADGCGSASACCDTLAKSRDGSESESSVQLTVTPRIIIQCECPNCESCDSNGGCDSSGCESCASAPSSQCRHESKSSDEYFQQVARMLVTTLKTSDAEAQQPAIEAALKMVAAKTAEKCEATACESRLASLESALDSMTAVSAESDSNTQIRSLLEPVYALQFRNAKQVESLITANRSLQHSIGLLESQLASFAMMQRAKLTQPEVRRIMESAKEYETNALEVEMLQDQLQALDQRIRQLQHSTVRPATYLEPVYSQERQLIPIIDTAEPESNKLVR